MPFTYDLSSPDPLTVEISMVRFELEDIVAGRGPRANGSNFSDEELTMVLGTQGALGAANRPMQAVAALCDTLARGWSKVASTSVGPRSQQFAAVADAFAKRAETLRAQYGGSGSAFAFSVAPNRDDGYSQNAALLAGLE